MAHNGTTFKLNTGAQIPAIGFGTWQDKDAQEPAVTIALKAGYRHIDTARIYGTEPAVGNAIKKSGIPREELFITTKLWNNSHHPDDVEKALDASLKDLGTDYLDLYLMHWPVAQEGEENHEEFVDTWRAMSLLLATGTVRHIGICNFSPSQLTTLLASTAGLIKPYAHQFELHPYLPQSDFLAWHAKHNIKVTAYSPLGNMNPTYAGKSSNSIVTSKGVHGITTDDVIPPLLENSLVQKIAAKRNCTPAQVALKWNLQRNVIVIPKSAHASRIAENFASETECILEHEDVEALKQLPVKRFNNPSKDYGVKLFQGLEDSEVDLGGK